METITENLSWAQHRDQQIVGSPAPTGTSTSQFHSSCIYSSGTIMAKVAERLEEPECQEVCSEAILEMAAPTRPEQWQYQCPGGKISWVLTPKTKNYRQLKAAGRRKIHFSWE